MEHITFIIGGMTRGGAERVISILANEYASKNWVVDIVLMLNNDIQYELDKKINIVDFTGQSSNRIKNLPNWISGLRKFVKHSKPDIIVSFVARINIIAMISTWNFKKRIILSERNDPAKDGRSKMIDIATKLIYPHADGIVFQTQRAKGYFDNRIQKKSVIISNPITVSSYARYPSKNKIVTVGRLAEQKNQKLLINAFSEISKKYPDYELWIYGEGKLRTELESLICMKRMEDRIFLPGNISNIHEQIADAEMFVLSSNYEGLSNALLEAMMMGLPCISTNCAGSDEYIENGLNGILFPVGNQRELENAMIKMISDKDFRKKIVQESKLRVLKCRSENVLTQWKKVIEGK